MTLDVVALCQRHPDAAITLAALRACGAALRMTVVDRGSLLQLCDDADRPLVTIEGRGWCRSAVRCSDCWGIDDAPHPAWWVEARAASNRPDAAAIARRFAAALLSVTGGVSWSSR